MSRYHSHINSAIDILKRYKCEELFASYLKKHFAANKKYSSKDRKQVSHLCYCYLRIGKMNSELPMEERLTFALSLCSDENNQVPDHFNDMFPFVSSLSDGIDQQAFILSHLKQPDLFLRLRP